jgi:MFS family permease
MTPTDPAPESLVRHRPFLFYWSARTVSAMAYQMIGVAVGWQMYALTGSALDLGLVGLAQFVPAVSFVLIAGNIADHYDRRVVLQLCRSVQVLAAAAIALGSLGGWIGKEFLLTAVFCLGAARAFEGPTNQTLLPSIVSATLSPRAVAASSSAQQVATIIGPAIGGLLYGLSATLVYTICSVLYFLAVVLLFFIDYQRTQTKRPPLSIATFFAGLAYIRENKIVFGAILLDLFTVLLGGATALLPIYAKDVLDVGPSGLGMLRAAPAAGSLLVLMVLTRWPLQSKVGRIMFAMVAIYGIATVVFAISPWFWLSFAALMFLGAGDGVSVVIRITLVQLETPDAMRGRVSSVNSLFANAANQLGDFRAGAMAAAIGAIPAALVGGIGTLIVVALGIRMFPELYRVESFRGTRQA